MAWHRTWLGCDNFLLFLIGVGSFNYVEEVMIERVGWAEEYSPPLPSIRYNPIKHIFHCNNPTKLQGWDYMVIGLKHNHLKLLGNL